MKKLLLGAAVAASMLLAGCDPKIEDLTAKIKQAQAYATAACAFLPTVETVASLFATGKISTALDAAKVICAAVTKTSARRGVGVPTAYGVRIRGQFVRR